MQIKILKILALLGEGDRATSENMYSVLLEVMKRSEPGKNEPSTNISNAILYECIRTITAIVANPKLLGMAAEITSRFLKVRFALVEVTTAIQGMLSVLNGGDMEWSWCLTVVCSKYAETLDGGGWNKCCAMLVTE